MSTLDKAKATTSNIWAKTKSNFFRTTQKAMVKLGKAEETVDINFSQERDKFKAHYKSVKKINADCQKLIQLFKDISVAQANLAEDFEQMFDAMHPLHETVRRTKEVAKQLDEARVLFEENVKKDFVDPTSKYIGQFKEIKQRIAERDERQVDMDRYYRDLRSLQEKAQNSSKIQHAENKYATAKTNYSNLNTELIQDLPLLYNDRAVFFQPAFGAYSQSLCEYYAQCYQFVAVLQPLCQHIVRDTIHDHVRVTTGTQESSAAHRLTAAAAPRSSTISHSDEENESTEPTHPPAASAAPSAPPMNAQPVVKPALAPAPRRSTVLPAPPVKPALPKAKALYDFNAQESNELAFKFGDVIMIHKMEGDWWEGELGGRRGLLPSNYVQLM